MCIGPAAGRDLQGRQTTVRVVSDPGGLFEDAQAGNVVRDSQAVKGGHEYSGRALTWLTAPSQGHGSD